MGTGVRPGGGAGAGRAVVAAGPPSAAGAGRAAGVVVAGRIVRTVRQPQPLSDQTVAGE